MAEFKSSYALVAAQAYDRYAALFIITRYAMNPSSYCGSRQTGASPRWRDCQAGVADWSCHHSGSRLHNPSGAGLRVGMLQKGQKERSYGAGSMWRCLPAERHGVGAGARRRRERGCFSRRVGGAGAWYEEMAETIEEAVGSKADSLVWVERYSRVTALLRFLEEDRARGGDKVRDDEVVDASETFLIL
ncbi:uncharacterized protein PG986_004214 [Apiospora aurea]|uniref:Uncharacterized protein n=1 Tax=Apiospora aurea TaxID=335848 RepID=A0ABR1QLY7_9PEZI